MATTETKAIDSIITSRRALLMGGAALAAAAVTTQAHAALTVTPADSDILNFALNLEYLEANFYYLAAFGCTINTPNAAAIAAGAPAAGIGIGAGTATTGTAPITGTGGMVPFALPAVKAYAIETAIEEGKHVILLRNALGSLAVAQPQLDISPAGAFSTVANAATVATTFNPYSSDANFLVGAYIFEDVGVTAYHGAAALIKTNAYLATAASILAVEAYHAGLVRTTIGLLDPNNALGYITATQKISSLRSQLSLQANTAVTTPDDIGLIGPGIGTTVQLDNGQYFTASRFTNADANVIAFARNTNQVLNIVTGGGALTAGAISKGVFFPTGLTGAIA